MVCRLCFFTGCLESLNYSKNLFKLISSEIGQSGQLRKVVNLCNLSLACLVKMFCCCFVASLIYLTVLKLTCVQMNRRSFKLAYNNCTWKALLYTTARENRTPESESIALFTQSQVPHLFWRDTWWWSRHSWWLVMFMSILLYSRLWLWSTFLWRLSTSLARPCALPFLGDLPGIITKDAPS